MLSVSVIQSKAWPLRLVFVFKIISTFIGENSKFLFYMHVLTMTIAYEKQT